MDKCKTAQGRRLLGQWIRQPLRDLALIKERHDIVDAFIKDEELRSVVTEDCLRRVPDLQQLAKKLARRKAGLYECYKCVDKMLLNCFKGGIEFCYAKTNEQIIENKFLNIFVLFQFAY